MPGFHTLKQEGCPLTATEVAVIDSIAALSDPGADRIMFWDESEDAFAWLTVGAGLTITDTTISASAATPTVITVANEATDETCFPAFFTAATGDLGPKTNAGLTFNSSTAVLSATGLAGAFNGSVGATTPSTIVGTTITANTGIVPDANDGAYLGQSGTAFSDLFLASGGVIDWLAGAVTITHSANTLTFGGSAFTTLALGATNITMTGSLAETGSRITKGWFTDLECTNAIAGSITGNAATVTNATLTTALTVNTGTLTLTANADNTSVLTIGSGAVSVSGSNTGDQDISGFATKALDNLASVAINTSLISDTDNTDDLGSADKAWKDIYSRTLKLDGATSGTVTIDVAAEAGTWTLTLPTTDGDNGQYLQTDGSGNTTWATVGGGTATAITVANEESDTTCFPVFVTAATGDLGPKSNAGLTFNSATAELSATLLAGAFNGTIGATTPSTIVGTTITANTGIVPDANDGAYLGTTALGFSDLFLASGGVINWANGEITLTETDANTLTLAGGTLALGANSLTMTGSIAATGNRVLKGWFTDVEITNLPTINGGTLATALSLGTMASETATNYVAKSLYDAHSVLYATSDNTPAALTVTEQSVVGRLTGGNISAVAIGIADNNIVQIDSADAADNDFAKFTANGLEGRSYSETLSDIGALPLAGGTMTGNITLGENTSIDHDPALSEDGKYTGLCITGTAGAALAFGDLITLDKDDSKWEKVDISVAAAATGDARGLLGICVLAANENAATKILLNGVVRADANFPALTIGAAVYASTTGDIVVTQPSTTDYVIRIVGSGLDGNSLYFNPENDWISHT